MLSLQKKNGFGIVGVIVAAGLVALTAMFIASFVTQQNKQSTKLELAGSCETIANSVIEYLKKDEASLFISSYGPQPGTTRYRPGLDTTDDGLDRFSLGGVYAPQFMGPSGFRMNLANGNRKLPNGWKYYNHLNIKNSTNRLLVLASNENFCCSSLDINSPNCGSRFLDDSVSRPGFRLQQRDIKVDLAVNFPTNTGGSLCGSNRRLLLTDNTVPDSQYREIVDFKIKVTVGVNGPNERSCSAQGRVQTASDVSPSLTLIELQNRGTMCAAGKQGAPSNCSAGSSVSYKVKTVKNSSNNSCITNCMAGVESRTCNSLGALNLFNTFSHASCTANCLNSEPGSAFLCKIGEKNWFNNPLNANVWEPCELTRVYDHDGSVAGAVSIAYQPVNSNDIGEVSTNATITLSGLRQNRAYVVDVRAVDTQGNVGSSFCNGSPSCGASSPPHFVVLPDAPVVSELSERNRRVTQVSDSTQRGRITTVTSQPKYSNILDPFGSNYYQCESGSLLYTVNLSNPTPSGAFAFTTAFCSGTLTYPNGSTVNIPSGTTGNSCMCTTSQCIASLPSATAAGPYQFQMQIQNDCGGGGQARSRDWCMDNNTSLPVSTTGNRAFGSNPDFVGQITYPSSSQKACGRVTLCPTVSGGYVPTLGTCANTTIGWNPMLHSGCLQDPLGNYCALVVDPCGRSRDAGPIQYSTTLIGVPLSGATPNNSCYSFNGSQVGGNICSPGSYCSDNGKCHTSCASPPCPTNVSSPSATNCGPKYCPVLNSCTISIGTTPASYPGCSPGPVNGACGPAEGNNSPVAPTTGLCDVGTASSVTGSGTGPFSWTCSGQNGGTDANCSTGTMCMRKVLFPYVGGSPGVNCVSAPVADNCTAGPCNPSTFTTINPYEGCANAACVCDCSPPTPPPPPPPPGFSCPGCTWQLSGGLNDRGCNVENCSGQVGRACNSPIRLCCNGTPGRLAEMVCR